MPQRLTTEDAVRTYGLDPRTPFEAFALTLDDIDHVLALASHSSVETVVKTREIIAQRTISSAQGLMTSDPEAVSRLPFGAGDRVAVLGDSLSACAGGWVDILSQVLKSVAPTVEMLNRAVSGRTTFETIGAMQPLIDFDPQWVLVMIGTNDVRRHGTTAAIRISSADEVRRSRQRLLEFLEIETRAKVVVITPPPIDPSTIDRNRLGGVWWTTTDVEELVATTLEISSAAIDVYHEVTTGENFWTEDGVHPSKVGHLAIARTVIRGLGRASGARRRQGYLETGVIV